MLGRLLDYFRCDLAIDLGTVNTRVGVVGRGIVVNEPSLVALDRSSRRVLSGGATVGHLARQMQGRTPDSIRIERPLVAGAVADVELCQALLRQFLRKSQPPGWRLPPRVLAAVPGGITAVEKRAVFSSLQRAGAGQVFLVPKSTAAAIGAALPIAEPLASMVCDVGGGATEVAVLSLGDTVARASVRVGGDRMDAAVVAYVRARYSLRIGPATAERLRIDIGSAYPLEDEQVQEITGLDTASGLPRRATITSEEVREALADPLDDVVGAVKDTLDACRPEMAADLIDHGMVLCGGAGLLRGLDRYLAEQTGIPTRQAVDPLTTVVQGALVAIENFERWRPYWQASEDV